MEIFIELSLVLVLATVVAGVMHAIKQPLIIGHILTGLLVGPYFLNFIHSSEVFEIFSHIGIALLLFIIGLSLNPRVIKEVGRISIITGLGQVFFTSFFGYLIAILLGYPPITSLYISIALTFSSTIIILKLLSDKRELTTLHGKIATGFLLVQDLVATLILIGVTTVTQGGEMKDILLSTGAKAVGLVLVFGAVINWLLPRLNDLFTSSQESLFLFSIGWGFGIASLFSIAGFSTEIGALFAGVALAGSPFSHEIAAKMRPLRDFFIVMFFIVLGSNMLLENLASMWLPALVFSLFILIGNPLVVMALMGFLGYSKETGFKSGLTVAQISEFSLVLVILGLRVGHISQEAVSMVTLVGIITIAASTYLILYSDQIYRRLAPYLSIFERPNAHKVGKSNRRYQLILFGYEKEGYPFVEEFSKRLDQPFLVVDYNPEIVQQLSEKGAEVLYGDAKNTEFLETLDLENAQIVVSSITDFASNLIIVTKTREENKHCVIIANSDSIRDALELYDKGASYVVMPHYLRGAKVSSLVSRGLNERLFDQEKSRHVKYLEKQLT